MKLVCLKCGYELSSELMYTDENGNIAKQIWCINCYVKEGITPKGRMGSIIKKAKVESK